MNIIEIIKTWASDYPTWKVLIGHKLVHVFGNGALGLVLGYTGVPIYIAVAVLVATSVGKEVSDHYRSYDSTADTSKGEDPYRYDAPMSSHAIDVILTVIGGVCGLVAGILITAKIAFILGLLAAVILTVLGLALASHD
jgi:hypothetical protein